VIKVAWIEVFFDPQKNERILVGTNHLVKDRSRNSGLIQERGLTRPGIYLQVNSRFC